MLAEARIDLDRYQQAFNRNAIAKQQLDDQNQTVKQDEGTVKNDQGTSRTRKKSGLHAHQFADRWSRRSATGGSREYRHLANGTTPLVVVTQLAPITVIFSVAEDYLSQIQKQLACRETN